MVCVFTVGVCSVDESSGLERLISLINEEALPDSVIISDIVIVVSGSSAETVSVAMNTQSRIQKTVIIEPKRSGKAEAINRIIDAMNGDNLLLINADAQPLKGSIGSLMKELAASNAGMMCATPLPADSECGPVVSALSRFAWSLHNSTMETLQETGAIMHLTDEMIAISGRVITALPEGTVNDGAYLSTLCQIEGEKVAYSKNAFIIVSIPHTLHDFIQQRIRIIYGHLQVKEMIGEFPGTAEFTSMKNPVTGLRILVDFAKRHPLESLFLPTALLFESVALAQALKETKADENPHKAWNRISTASWK
jgi:cellulose synthase/poly-beta-1,6-N-acetylglucosamine synthase-like glycosyltransferase